MAQRGSQNEDKESKLTTLSVLLVSTLPGFCSNLKSAIFRAKKLTAYKLQIHLCEAVEHVTEWAEISVTVDFVVFGLDVQKTNCIEQMKRDINKLDNSFISCGDYCMVINPNVPSSEMGVSWDNLLDLQIAYQMLVINGDTEDEDKCSYLGQRVLCFIESVKGIHSGLPFYIASACDVLKEEDAVARRLAFMDA